MKHHTATFFLSRAVLFLAAIMLTAGAARVEAATWYAAPGATGSGTSASDPGDIRTLVESRSASGDTIRLASGTFNIPYGGLYSGLNVDHPLIIIGAGRGKTILKCLNTAVTLRIEVNASTTANLAVKSMTFLDGGYYQVDIVNGNATIDNVEFKGEAVVSSLIVRQGRPIVKKSFFKAATPIGLSGAGAGAPQTVTGCVFSVPGGTGIDFVSVAACTVEKNTFSGNKVGLSIYAAPAGSHRLSASHIQNNTFKNNIWGISLWARFGGTDKCTIRGNTFHSNIRGLTGVASLQSVEKSSVDSNRFLANEYGLMLDSTRNTVINNLFVNNKKTSLSSAGGVSTIAFNTVAHGRSDGLKLTKSGGSTGDRSLVANNIFCSNTGYGISLDASSLRARLGGNDTYANTKGTIFGVYADFGGNLAVAPRFKSGSYALATGSPLIDQAIAAYTVAYDITGASRTDPDIGAYEYQK